MTEPFLASALVTLRSQINERWPRRDRASDGWIGDARHSEGNSDHNPLPSGLVCAIDVTNDPPHEVHCAQIAEAIRASRDARLSYLIFNHFILRSYAKPGVLAWTWAPYAGLSPHDHHLHVSVLAAKAEDAKAWNLPANTSE